MVGFRCRARFAVARALILTTSCHRCRAVGCARGKKRCASPRPMNGAPSARGAAATRPIAAWCAGAKERWRSWSDRPRFARSVKAWHTKPPADCLAWSATVWAACLFQPGSRHASRDDSSLAEHEDYKRRSGSVINIKTNKHLVSSLRGASFRRVSFDGRTRLLRTIRTLRSLRTPSRRARSTRRTIT